MILPLAAVCLLAGACAKLSNSESPANPNASIDPTSAIAVSVLDDAVYLFDPSTGRTATVVGDLIDFQSGYATWAPDHTLLAYSNAGIFVLDFSIDQQRTVVRGPTLSAPAWSSDGASIAYVDGSSLWVTPSGRLEPVRVRLPATIAPLGTAWQPGKLIAFQGVRRDCSHSYLCPSTGQSDIWVVRRDGTGLAQVTRVRHAEDPKWSPDGSRLMFIRRYRNDAGRRELWVANRDGTGARRLVTGSDVVAADWSPDGSRIVIVRSGSAPNTLQVWIARDDGSNARRLGSAIPGTEATVDW